MKALVFYFKIYSRTYKINERGEREEREERGRERQRERERGESEGRETWGESEREGGGVLERGLSE